MNIFLLFSIFSVLAEGFSFPNKNPSGIVKDEWISIPDTNGVFYRANLNSLESSYAKSKGGAFRITYRLFTRCNPVKGQRIPIGNVTALESSHFDPQNPTRVIVHGWLGNKFSRVNTLLTEAYLKRGNYNIIVADWGQGANTVNYFYARKNVDVAGRKIGSFIDFLVSHGTPLDSVYLIGQSLGAHVVGIAAKSLKTGRLRTIIGLDAAKPLFSFDNSDERLDRDDADYVQSIQTNGGILGFNEPLGHGSFYPNWGQKQPGCGYDLTGSCAHGRVVDYFVESLRGTNTFVSFKCQSFEVILNKKCSRGEYAVLGGDPINTNFTGVYYVPINSKHPFGSGKAYNFTWNDG